MRSNSNSSDSAVTLFFKRNSAPRNLESPRRFALDVLPRDTQCPARGAAPAAAPSARSSSRFVGGRCANIGTRNSSPVLAPAGPRTLLLQGSFHRVRPRNNKITSTPTASCSPFLRRSRPLDPARSRCPVRARRGETWRRFLSDVKAHRRQREALSPASPRISRRCNHSNFCSRHRCSVNGGGGRSVVDNEESLGDTRRSRRILTRRGRRRCRVHVSARRRASVATRKEVTIIGGSRDAPRGVQQL